MKKNYIFFHILDLTIKSYFFVIRKKFLFHMYIDMGERIAGKYLDRPSLIIEDPPPPVVFPCCMSPL